MSISIKATMRNKQLIVMSDASFTVAGYALMIEDDQSQTVRYKGKTHAAIAIAAKTFDTTQTKMSI